MRRFWVYKFEGKKSWRLVLPKQSRMQKIEVEIQKKKIWFSLITTLIYPLLYIIWVRVLKSYSNRTKLSMTGSQLFSGWCQMCLDILRCFQMLSGCSQLVTDILKTFSDMFKMCSDVQMKLIIECFKCLIRPHWRRSGENECWKSLSL